MQPAYSGWLRTESAYSVRNPGIARDEGTYCGTRGVGGPEVLANALAESGIESATVRGDREAISACELDAPQLVITSINRQSEDMQELQLVRAMRKRRPLLRAIYLAALWPARLHQYALDFHERFLPKPVPMTRFVQTVRELLPA
jgi:DNA-binding NtrC family response regulator